MPILSITTSFTGEIGVLPARVSILTNDSEATVLTTGYLNKAVQNGTSFPLPCLAEVATKETSTSAYIVGWYQVSHIGANWSLIASQVPGDVVLPTVAGAIASFTNTTGTLSDNQENVTNSFTTSSTTPGTIRSLIGAIADTGTVVTTGNLVGVRGSVTMVGASGGFFYGLQGKIISSGTLSGSSWTAGVFGQLDISAATVNAGQTAPIWADYGTSSGTITSATGMRMFAGTNTTAATLHSMIYLYGKSSNLLELDLNGSTYISTGGSGALSGTIQKIAITIEDVQYYIPCATVIS